MSSEELLAEQSTLLRKMLIVQLGLAGVPQTKIRAIVGCSMQVVSDVMKEINPKYIQAQKEG